MNLEGWTVAYVEHKDVMDGRLEGYEEKDDGLEFRFDHGTEFYHVQEDLSIAEGNIVCLNTEENLDRLVENWDEAVDVDPRIIFVHPEQNSKWIVKPATHDRVADPENLREGLETLQDNTVLVENN